VSTTFIMCVLTHFIEDMEEDGDEEPLDLRSNHSQEGGDHGKPLAKGQMTRNMVKHI